MRRLREVQNLANQYMVDLISRNNDPRYPWLSNPGLKPTATSRVAVIPASPTHTPALTLATVRQGYSRRTVRVDTTFQLFAHRQFETLFLRS